MQSIDEIVKPLEWTYFPGLGLHEAVSVVGRYVITENGVWWRDGDMAEIASDVQSAKASAQSHFNAAIASAIDLSSFRPSVIHYEEGDYSQMLLEDCATITGHPMALVEPLYRMSDRALIGFQWSGKEPSAIDLDKVRRETWEEATKIAEDYGHDAMSDSDYRLACNDLSEALRARATAKGGQTDG